MPCCKYQGLNLSTSYFCPIFQNRAVLKHRSLKHKVLNHSIIQSLSCLLIILSIFDKSEKLQSQNWILKVPGSSQENRKSWHFWYQNTKLKLKCSISQLFLKVFFEWQKSVKLAVPLCLRQRTLFQYKPDPMPNIFMHTLM